jgi:hypothetical protein
VPMRSFQEEYEQAREDARLSPTASSARLLLSIRSRTTSRRVNDPAPIMPLAEQLEQERAKTPSQ